MKVSVGYSREEQIANFPIGTVYACGQNLWVKIENRKAMMLGSGETCEIKITCMARIIKSIEAET